MISNVVGRLLNPKLERSFLRFVVAILLLVFLATQLPLGEKLLGRILNFPDLRHQVVLNISKDGSGNNLDSASLQVVNLGFGTAENVLVHINSPHGRILDYEVDSQELYQAKNIDLESGALDFWLDRFTAGASIRIELIGTGFITDTILLSAASDQGVNSPMDSPSFSGQVESSTAKVAGIFDQAIEIIRETQSMREAKEWSSTKPVVVQVLQIISSNEFQIVCLAALIVILLVVILLPDGCLAYSVSLITGFVVWLFFNFQIPTWWAITLAVAILTLFGSTAASTDPEGCLYGCGILLVLLLAVGGFAVWYWWYTTVSAQWILGPATSIATYTVIALASIKPGSAKS